MAPLKNKISADFKETLKEKDEVKISTLRLLNAALLSRQKEKRYKISKTETEEELSEKELQDKSELSDEEILEVILSEIKKRKEAILEFEKGKRQDLVEKETKEMEILQRYLPEQLLEEEIRKLAREAIEKVDAKELKEVGRVMAELMPKVKGKAEGSLVSKIVKELLSK